MKTRHTLYRLYGFRLTRREKHVVLVDKPHPQSAAHLILLKAHYYRVTHQYDRTGNWRIWLTFRNKFLRNMKRLMGSLDCFYCGKTNLTANTNSLYAANREATVDHFVPLAHGGSRFDYNNLRVCCNHCNQKKADKMPDVFMRELDARKVS